MCPTETKNPELEWLEKLNKRAKDIHDEEKIIINKIRSNFVNRAIVFMDVVGSTAFKIEHKDTPEKWILRVCQFSELLASAVINANGRVIKFIGDEIMATFDNVNDAQNLVGRIPEIEHNLHSATGFETRIKVAVDFGPVYELTFEGHDAPDPQGSAVDRCARIAKFGMPGEVLTSASFAEQTPRLNWTKVGSTELKGLGRQSIFQLGKNTADIEPRVEVKEKDHAALLEELDDLRTKIARTSEQNRQLQQQLKEVGERPLPDAIITDEQDGDSSWEEFENAKKELSKLISGTPGSSNRFARFLFLFINGMGGDEYNKYEGKVFDDLIESKFVIDSDGNYFTLNPAHKRNIQILATIDKIKRALEKYLETNDQDEEDLFEWSLSDPEFWNTYLDYNVLN